MSGHSLLIKDPTKLEKLLDFAQKGGIGKGIANQDITASGENDLMFFTGETIVVLKHVINDIYLGYCEGVIGTFRDVTVDFQEPLTTLKSLKLKQRQQQNHHNENSNHSNNSNDNNYHNNNDGGGFLLPSDAIRTHLKQSSKKIPNPPKRLSGLPKDSVTSASIITTIPNSKVSPSLTLNSKNHELSSKIINHSSVPPTHRQHNDRQNSSSPSLNNNPEILISKEQLSPINKINRNKGLEIIVNQKISSNHSSSTIPNSTSPKLTNHINTTEINQTYQLNSRNLNNHNHNNRMQVSSRISPASLPNSAHSINSKSINQISYNGQLSLRSASPISQNSINNYNNVSEYQKNQSMNPNIVSNKIGHYSPSTSPLPSPAFPKVMINDSPIVDSVDDDDDINDYNTYPVSTTPVIIAVKQVITTDTSAPKIALDKDIDGYNNYGNYKKDNYTPQTLQIPNERLSVYESDVTTEDEADDMDKFEKEINKPANSGESKSIKKKILAIDEYGFVYDVSEKEIPPGADRTKRTVQAPGAEEKTTRVIKLYREREAKWLVVLGTMNPNTARDSKKIKKLARLGIPESIRGKSWQFMAGAEKYRKYRYYDELRKRPDLPIYDVIERDINRCYPDHIQFRKETGSGQEDLYDVLKAYAHYSPEIGYCQGMGRLVGMMLMQMPAEDAFWLLVATIDGYMNDYYTPTLAQIRIDAFIFEKLLAEHDPKLSKHLADNDIIPLIYMTQWFMTLFTMALPWASVLRVWDIFYFEGTNLFFRVGLAMLDCVRDHILKNCPTSSEILSFILHIPHELLTPDPLLEAIFKIKLKATNKNNTDITSSSKKSKQSKSSGNAKIKFKLVGE
nr:12142_t:CDS:10 [Entrophospora candida]